MKKDAQGRHDGPDTSGEERGGGPDSAKGAGADYDSPDLEKGGGPDSAKAAKPTKKPGRKGNRKTPTGSEVTR